MTGTQMFLWTHVELMKQALFATREWVDILSIPIDMLTFPVRGKRKLLFEISVASLGQIQNPLVTASYSCEHTNLSFGYVDGIKLRIKTEELGLKYAAAVSAIDGFLDDVEKAVVRKWMDSRIDSLPENMQADTTRFLSRALMLAERLSASIKPCELVLLCDDIAEDYPIGSFPKGELYDIVELCMKVAAADVVANPEELKLVDRIASLLGVDQERLKKMSEKILPVNMHSEKDIESILGLKPGWNQKEEKTFERTVQGVVRKGNSYRCQSPRSSG
ncbi:MAG: TerB family tellurite resistance protein [Candidatus Sabulitectum sp.]|nr:TerB family tellurite resistance protein [Candidatus Sabulitectum sp.]